MNLLWGSRFRRRKNQHRVQREGRFDFRPFVKNRDGLPQKIVLLEIGDFQIWRQALQGEAGVIGLLARDDSFPIAPSRESRL